VKTDDLIKQENSYIAKTFNRNPVAWSRAKGSRVWDVEGKEYLDFFTGAAVMGLGHGHPGQLKAMQEQMGRFVHCGNLFYQEPQIALARALTEKTFGKKVFFYNTGAEIVELGIKLARRWARRNDPRSERYEIITMRNSFHGRTYGALSATGQEKCRQGRNPMLPGFKHVALNDLTAAAAAITDKTCAILVEPIQGEGGIHLSDPAYLKSLRDLCHRNDLLLIFDEIQCGLGRAGYFNAYEHYQVIPDVMFVAKPLGGGLPISAMTTREEIAAVLQPGDHGTTFGGNPVAAAAGLVLMDELSKPGFLEEVRSTGEYLGQVLNHVAAEFPGMVATVRGLGLMWGMELKEKPAEVFKKALENGLILNLTVGTVLRFLPALIITRKDVDEAADKLRAAFKAVQV